ncbi:MAG: DNA mismatch repair endonuclease MutL [Nitrospira sp.]|nr:DNA mismatch repair endonuclease MutL [Nitrospira sp.]
MLTVGGSGKIHILPDDVVSRIAAGEVVERPAAVVKELVDNSVDAGARSITVEAKDGGLALIRVTDDGEGMSRDDAPRAFDRHATSKLRSDQDLWSIRTMGFRGEALPSIASVSRVRLATAVRSAETGIEFRVEGGRIGTIAEAPPVAGTIIEVAELFYNQPARKKFLKSIPTELSHISRVIQQAALAWPSVHFRLIHNGTEMVNYPAVQAEHDRVAQVYRRQFLDQCRTVRAELPVARIGGYAIDPVHARSSRTPQELFLNRRPVRNAAILHAVAEGYGASLAKGCHPLFVLFLDVDPDRVDVNVHPTKREVRFSEPDMIHQLVRRAVRQAMDASKPFTGVSGVSATSEGTASRFLWSPAVGVPLQQSRFGGTAADDAPSLARGAEVSSGPEAQLGFVSETAEPYGTVPMGEVAALGQLKRTFLVVRIGGDLAVIDQHTAHERVLFERLYRAWTAQGIRAQQLLLPETVELSAPHAALLRRHQGDLEKLGLELEPFGSSAVLIRSVPTGLGKIKPDAFLEDLLDDLNQWDRASTVEMKVRPVLASLACHGAVRAGRSMELPEIEALVEDWRTEGEMTTCPHGRRTVFRLSTDELEKMFGRAGW